THPADRAPGHCPARWSLRAERVTAETSGAVVTLHPSLVAHPSRPPHGTTVPAPISSPARCGSRGDTEAECNRTALSFHRLHDLLDGQGGSVHRVPVREAQHRETVQLRDPVPPSVLPELTTARVVREPV